MEVDDGNNNSKNNNSNNTSRQDGGTKQSAGAAPPVSSTTGPAPLSRIRMAGQISSTIHRGPMTTLRQNPNLSLGTTGSSVQMRQFKPVVPATPHVPTTQHENDDFGRPELASSAARPFTKGDARGPQGRQLQQQQRSGRDKFQKQRKDFAPMAAKKSVVTFSGGSASSSGGADTKGLMEDDMMDEGDQDKTKLSAAGSAEDESGLVAAGGGDVKGKKKKRWHIDAMNVDHPVTIPFVNPKAELEERVKREPGSVTAPESIFMKEQEFGLFQLPTILPINLPPQKAPKEKKDAKSATAAGKSGDGSNGSGEGGGTSFDDEWYEWKNTLQAIPEGLLGKLQIFKSGKIRFKIGDYYYEVERGSAGEFLQHVVVTSPGDKQCFELGNLAHRFMIVPDMNTLLASAASSSSSSKG